MRRHRFYFAVGPVEFECGDAFVEEEFVFGIRVNLKLRSATALRKQLSVFDGDAAQLRAVFAFKIAHILRQFLLRHGNLSPFIRLADGERCYFLGRYVRGIALVVGKNSHKYLLLRQID